MPTPGRSRCPAARTAARRQWPTRTPAHGEARRRQLRLLRDAAQVRSGGAREGQGRQARPARRASGSPGRVRAAGRARIAICRMPRGCGRSSNCRASMRRCSASPWTTTCGIACGSVRSPTSASSRRARATAGRRHRRPGDPRRRLVSPGDAQRLARGGLPYGTHDRWRKTREVRLQDIVGGAALQCIDGALFAERTRKEK